MSWTETTRLQYRRNGLRYSSDMLDAEWELIAPFVAEDRRLGRPRATVLRAVVEAIVYIAATGCQWRMLPKEFPPYSTVQRYFYRWRDTGTWERINHTLLMQAREAAGREASPSARSCPSRWWKLGWSLGWPLVKRPGVEVCPARHRAAAV